MAGYKPVRRIVVRPALPTMGANAVVSRALHLYQRMKFTVQRYDSVGDIAIGEEEERGGGVGGVEPLPRAVEQFALVQTTTPEEDEGEEGEDEDGDLHNRAPTKPHSDTPTPTETAETTPYATSTAAQAMSEPMARRGRLYANRQQRRLVFKDGECNISLGNVKRKSHRYLGDIFTTFLEMRWRYVLAMFMAAFVMSWILFAFLWWVVLVSHQDHLHKNDDTWSPCMGNVYDFTTALLFSIETQHTIGYGLRVMEPKCPEALFLLMLQSCIGVFIQSLMTGIIFAKLSRPKRRANTIMICKNAVICQRDGEYVLLFRVADIRRKSHLVATTVRVALVRNRITKEGELIPLAQVPLEVIAENAVDYYLFLVWPTTVTHVINESSPLWEMSAESLLSEHFEIIVYLEGTVESTGMTTQVRTSYLPSEIFWGHRLEPLVTYQKENGSYKVDYNQFHATVPVSEMPECSAKDYNERSGSSDSSSTPRKGLTHHMSFMHNLPGTTSPLPGGRVQELRDLHSFTVAAQSQAMSPVMKRMSKSGRRSSGLENFRRKRSRKWILGKLNNRLNGFTRSNSLCNMPSHPHTPEHDEEQEEGEDVIETEISEDIDEQTVTDNQTPT